MMCCIQSKINKNTFNLINFRTTKRDKSWRTILKYLNITLNDSNYNNIFNERNSSIFNALKDDYNLVPETENIKTHAINRSSNINIERFVGWGINNEEIPQKVKFGRLLLLLNKLYYKNILSLKNQSGHAIEHFANVKISDALVEIIYKLCKNENINNAFIKFLNNDEKQLLDTILYMSGLQKNIYKDRPEQIKKLKIDY